MVYVARAGDDYRAAGPGIPDDGAGPGPPADAWLYYTGRWPDRGADFGPFFEELMAEMEAMASGSDRCRWPLDDPWPHSH